MTLSFLMIACGGGVPSPAADAVTADSAVTDSEAAVDTSGGVESGHRADSAGGAVPADSADSATRAYTPAPDAALQFEGERPRNLLILSIDTLRRNNMSRWAGGSVTPNLDAMMEDGLVLDHLRCAANWTFPSMLAALSGAYNEDLGLAPMRAEWVPDEVETLAEVLDGRGYASAIIHSQPILHPSSNLLQGYASVLYEEEWTAAEISAAGLGAASALGAGDAPWLLHLHYFDPHLPWGAPHDYLVGIDEVDPHWYNLVPDPLSDLTDQWPEFEAREREIVLHYLQVVYDAQLRYMDEHIGRLIDGLWEAGLLEETLVVVFSDHGEQFLERGAFGHGEEIFAEETLGLGFFWSEGLTPGRVDHLVAHADLAPTVLDALGLPPMVGATGEIIGTFDPRRPAFSLCALFKHHELEVIQSVEIDSDRLIYWWDGPRMLFALSDLREEPELGGYDPKDPRVVELEALLSPRTEAIAAILDAKPD